ncbi:hypothetical protein FB567DRAFT_252660 [Paraphoma chrysanthemicola]|uniref:Ubiquitin-like protease family profile domain-containing protein n=1 Tax=Paraphoma chrysanthemicola TaxID=798071 RepID=A0A8K0VRJ0_9PLEO|nr:hypothetical protein FB567DRAFT_252660 [Paraphoma chrysanthemicola]
MDSFFGTVKSYLLRSPTTSHAAEATNDVRSLSSKLAGGAFHRLLTLTYPAPLPTRPADAMPHQTDDAAIRPNTRALPRLPFSHGPHSSPRSSKTATVDLTSPEPQSHAEALAQHAHGHALRLPLKTQRSSDEKRLTGDFQYGLHNDSRHTPSADVGHSVPADRVDAPHPSSYFLPRPTMVKPGAGKAFQPLDTLNGPIVGSSTTRPVTYSKSSRPRSSLIGKDRGAGQKEFEAIYLSSNPLTPAQNTPSRQNFSSASRQSPHSKRRKTEHVSSPSYVDLIGDDEVQEVSKPLSQSKLPRSSRSSRSHVVIDSHTQPVSEFRAVEDLAKPKAKTKSWQTRTISRDSIDRSLSGSITPRAQNSPIHVIDDESVAPPVMARRRLLQDFKQGVSSPNGGHIVSPHFPNARINESTSDVQSRSANATNGNLAKKDLRKFRRAPSPGADEDAISDDELQQALPNDPPPRSRRKLSPTKPLQVANRGAKRKTAKTDDTSICWPLYYARTHCFEVTSSDINEELQIRQRGNEWDIGLYDRDGNAFDVKIQINPLQINKVSADDIGSIRLEGPRRQDGNCSIFDLVFAEPGDFYIFRDRHAVFYAMKQKVYKRTDKEMARMIDKGLPTNDKVGNSSLVNDEMPVEEESGQNDSIRSVASGLWSRLKAAKQDNGKGTTNGGSRASNRPVRSTRSSAPIFDPEETIQTQDVEKYSIKIGLGPRWQRPLTYGEGRQKATVYFDELPRLDEEEFMNDSLIDFYMIYLFDKSNIPKDKVFFFNTYFFTKLTQNTGRSTINYSAVERWTNKVDVFTYDYIVVPINEQTHWYLAIICNVGNIARKPVKEAFCDGTADDSMIESVQVENDSMTVDIKVMEPPSEDIPRASTPIPDRDDEDVNLFDEESKLDDESKLATIDPEATETAQQVPVPSSPMIDLVQSTEVSAANAPQNESGPRTVLSNLNASPSKKKTKRKFKGIRKDPNVPIIMILDSLSQTRSGTVRALKDWLAAEGKARRAMDVTIKEHGFYPKSDQIPTQDNWTDCGVYLLGYAEKFFANPDEFKNKLLTGEMTADEDWPQLKPKEMRNNLRDIIFALAKDQKLTEEVRKKGKKGKAANKSSPPEKVSSIEDAESQQPAEGPGALVKHNSVLMDGSTANIATQEPVNDQIEETMKPRLGSPIVFKPRPADLMIDSAPPEVKAPEPRTSSHSVSPSKITPRSSGSMQIPGRRTSPQVRIFVSNSPSQVPLGKEPQQERGSTDTTTTQPESQRKSNSLSPGKRARATGEDDDELRVRPKKMHASHSPQKSEHDSAHMTLDLGQPPEGHSDHPIEIMDSQDLKPLAIQSPRRLHVDSPAQRRQPSRSPRKLQVLRHEPSVEEIPRPPNYDEPPKQPPHESRQVGYQLVRELGTDGKMRSMYSRVEADHSMPPTDLPQSDGAETEPESMEIDSQGADPMDIADDTVRETPTPKRSSPPPRDDWVQGESLPL